jgi:hypothetical protein
VTGEEIRTRVLTILGEAGRVRPADLVQRVSLGSQVSVSEVREALHGLVESRQVGLNWNGEFVPAASSTPTQGS